MQHKYTINISFTALLSKAGKAAGIILWALLIIICFLCREQFTVEGIIGLSPENWIAAALVLVLCFGLKSLTVFVYSGILYAASGILFPLPLALIVNLIGTIVMATIPYVLGMKLGSNAVNQLTEKYPKLQTLQEFQGENEILMTFFIRMIGIVPGDLAAMYSGASHASYGEFLTGTLLGMLPMMTLFCFMGMSIQDPASPVFILSAITKIILAVVSAIWFSQRRKCKRTQYKGA